MTEFAITSLIQAADAGNLEMVKSALASGESVHYGNDWAFRCAARKGRIEVVEFLVNSGADIHANNDQAVVWAADSGCVSMVRYLAHLGLSTEGFLIKASRNGKFEIVKFCVEEIGNIEPIEFIRAIYRAASERHFEIADWLLNYSEIDLDKISFNDLNDYNVEYQFDVAMAWKSAREAGLVDIDLHEIDKKISKDEYDRESADAWAEHGNSEMEYNNDF